MINQQLYKGGSANTMRKRFQFVSVGLRYGLNLMDMVARQQGYKAAAVIGSRFAAAEIAKLPRIFRRAFQQRNTITGRMKEPPVVYSAELLWQLSALNLNIEPLCINPDSFRSHVAHCNYPKNYAAGSMNKGGLRDKKLLEYFLSLELLDVQKN